MKERVEVECIKYEFPALACGAAVLSFWVLMEVFLNLLAGGVQDLGFIFSYPR